MTAGDGRSGPLVDVRVIELAGLGPGPFCAMMLADMGADVIRVDRLEVVAPHDVDHPPPDVLGRGRRSIGVDLKTREGVEVVLRLAERADVFIEGFRPGVAERLGVGPEECRRRNKRLVYGRMTGWGQTGPYAQVPGHDINYIALAGVLEPIGRAGQPPVPPLNLVADFGGGGMMLAFGIVAALFEAQRSGLGQIVDAAMVDGSAALINVLWSLKADGSWRPERGTNLLDGGAPFYDVYECADGDFISLGAIEPKFYGELLRLLGPDHSPALSQQMDREAWPEMKRVLAEVFLRRTRPEWCELLEHSEACFAPVLTPEDALTHPHNVERGTFTERFGIPQAVPVPRFSRTRGALHLPPSHPGQHTDEIMSEFGLGERIEALRAQNAIR